MRIATFNVNGLAGSETAVHKACKVLGIDILCLVNTCRPGFQTRVWAKYATRNYQVLAIHVKPGLNFIGVYITPNAERTAIHECLSRLKSLCHGPTVIV